MMKNTRFYIALLVTLLFSVQSGCAGYRLGLRSLYRNDIRTVYVPIFQSESYRRQLSERLTEAVIKEIENKTPYKVISDPTRADLILDGRLVWEKKHLLAENATDEAREVEAQLAVQVQWQFQNHSIAGEGYHWSQPVTVSVDPEFTSYITAESYIPETGQSLTTAQQKAFEKTARLIVAHLEQPW
ncbi:MAG: LPS assembly lipoprotein LptE [Pirellulaceae bacterium]|nr:LPS assembly lipoprotein LptE [Pirellulaceae bacterium]